MRFLAMRSTSSAQEEVNANPPAKSNPPRARGLEHALKRFGIGEPYAPRQAPARDGKRTTLKVSYPSGLHVKACGLEGDFMQNLRDKLLQAGLVKPEDAQRAETAKAAAQRPRNEVAPPPRRNGSSGPRHNGGPGPVASRPPVRELAIPKLPPLPGSKAHQRIEAQKQREIDAQLRELVLTAQVPVERGEKTFFFVTRKGKLRRLELSEAQAKLLEEGKLAVVERQEPAQIEHSLVPPETAAKMFVLLPKAVRFFNREGAPVGFLSDDELKSRQADEAAGIEPQSEDDVPPAADGSEPSVEPPAEAAPTAGPETWIAIKRAKP